MGKSSEELKKRYKNGSDFTSDISNRTMQILKDIEVFLDAEEDVFDDVSVTDYFAMFSLRDKINELIEEHA